MDVSAAETATNANNADLNTTSSQHQGPVLKSVEMERDFHFNVTTATTITTMDVRQTARSSRNTLVMEEAQTAETFAQNSGQTSYSFCRQDKRDCSVRL